MSKITVDPEYLQELEYKAKRLDQINKDIEHINSYIKWENFTDLKYLIKFLYLNISVHSSFAMMRVADLLESIFKIDWYDESFDDKIYYMNGWRHRDNGPAVEKANGDKEYFIEGRRHREDGPAIDCSDKKEWWYKGQRVLVNSQAEFERELLLLNFK